MEFRMSPGDEMRLYQRINRFYQRINKVEREQKLYRILLALTLILGGIIIWIS